MSACTECGRCHHGSLRWKPAINVASKKDDSPVTAADIAAHKVIVSGLQALDRIPHPLLGGPAVLEVRQHWQRYWLVDPLDGTKEFIKRNGEFTVNIALIENGKPTLGVVYAPVMKVMYSAQNGKAWKKSAAYASRSRSAMPVRRWW